MQSRIIPYNESLDSQITFFEVGAEKRIASRMNNIAAHYQNQYPIICEVNSQNNASVNILREYYDTNKTEIENLVKRIINNTKISVIGFASYELLTEEIIQTIKANPNITHVSIPAFPSVPKEKLSKIFIKLYSRPMHGININKFITQDDTIILSEHLSPEMLEIFKELFTIYPQKKVIICDSAISQVRELVPLIKSQVIIIDDRNMYQTHSLREYFEYSVPEDSDKAYRNMRQKQFQYDETIKSIESSYTDIIEAYNNVEFAINLNLRTISSQNIKMKNQILSGVINEVKNLNLSPVETYMYLYDLVKFFKEYKEAPSNAMSELSRRTEYILFNEYIVCAGYVDLLEELISKLDNSNLQAVKYTCRMRHEENRPCHARCMVNIQDSKYNISGMYMSDPTFESSNIRKMSWLKYSYEYFLMTKNYYDSLPEAKRNFYHDCTDILFKKSDEFDPAQFTETSWDDAHYITWKFSSINTKSFVISDPLEVSQQEIGPDLINEIFNNLYSKVFAYTPDNSFIKKIHFIKHLVFDMERHLKSRLKVVKIEELENTNTQDTPSRPRK